MYHRLSPGIGESERKEIQSRIAGTGKSVESVLEQATSTLSGLSRCAGIVLAPKTDSALKHIEFVNLGPGRALVVMVTADGIVENQLLVTEDKRLVAAQVALDHGVPLEAERMTARTWVVETPRAPAARLMAPLLAATV